MKRIKLTPKQQRFIDEYLIDLNATHAAIRAGYSKKTARSSGNRMLTFVAIQKEIQDRQNKQSDKLEVTKERVLRELSRIAFLDPRKFWTEDGRLKEITELDTDQAAAVAGMDIEDLFEGFKEDRVQSGRLKKIKLANKNTALDMLSKHLGLYEKDNDQKKPPDEGGKITMDPAAFRAIIGKEK